MGKPVKQTNSGRVGGGGKPEKRLREPSPPSSESEPSDAGSDGGGEPLPPLEVALLLTLREEEASKAFATLTSYGAKYRALHTRLSKWKANYILDTIQPTVHEALQSVDFLRNSSDDPRLSFYNTVFRNAFRAGLQQFLNQHNMKVTSVGMSNQMTMDSRAEGKNKKSKQSSPQKQRQEKVYAPFTVEDIIPSVRCDDGDEIFTSFMTAVTAEYLCDETAVSNKNESFHAVEYTFHFAPGNPNFSNRCLRIRFYFQGGVMYRQAQAVFGRLVDVHADEVMWTNEETKSLFLTASSPFSWFRGFFSGTLPTISPAEKSAEGAFVVPKEHLAIRDVLERHLGTLAAIPNRDVSALDLELLQRMFQPFESSGIALSPMCDHTLLTEFQQKDSAPKPNKSKGASEDEEEEDDEVDPSLVAKKVAAYFDVVRRAGAACASGKGSLTLEQEINLVRHVVLLNAGLHYIATVVLMQIATNPTELAVSFPLGDNDDEEDEDLEVEEGEEDEEGDDEEEEDSEGDEEDEEEKKEPAAAPPAKVTSKKQPECKHQ